MADATLSEIVEEAATEEGVRKVQVEIIHKHEERSSSTTWAVVLGVVLLLGSGLFYIAENSDGLLSGDDSVVGNCADNIDHDSDGLKDAQDPGCRTNGVYDEEGYEQSQ